MEEILKADLIKPKYDAVKAIWASMLNEYYTDGRLNPDYTITVACPFCKSTKTLAPFSINGFNHVTCLDCSVVYVTPRLKDEYLEKLYNNKYYSEIYAKSMIPAFDVRKRMIGGRKTDQTLKHLATSKTGPLDVLDIGCGIGEVIDVFKDRGHRCTAIEVNPIAVEWLDKNGISVFADTFHRFPEEKKFDVIMAWGVIEHVVDPHAFVKKVQRQLKPGGVFASEVPNGQCLTVDYARETGKDPARIIMGEQHIILYSMKAYESLHQNAGLEKIHTQTNGLDVETVLKLNNERLNDSVILEMQRCIDAYGKGDLIRGFWRKPLG
jgi:2-polyprenyl-3-methyl-5-hydroxy-6-metoxy-1,4-benzoquinol methylase